MSLIRERGSANVTIAAIAESADLSRQVIYQQFGDRDTLIVESALDLLRRELLPLIAQGASSSGRERALSTARHFAEHRGFYRSVLVSSCAAAFSRGLIDLHLPPNRALVADILGPDHDSRTADDLAHYLTGGGITFLTAWVVNGPERLDCEGFVDRVEELHAALLRPERPPPHPEGTTAP